MNNSTNDQNDKDSFGGDGGSGNESENVPDADPETTVSNRGIFLQTPSPIQENPQPVLMEEGNDEGGQVQFEFHFPEEIWLMILALLDDQDRVNCCRAFPYLDSISTMDKPVFLAKEVLPLVGEWLNLNELLSCRQICKNWNEGVDQLIYSKRASTTTPDSECFYKFENEGEVEHFLQTFAGHSRSPIIDGTIYIIDRDEDMGYVEIVLELIREYGKHIKILIVEDFCEVLDPSSWYHFLQEALQGTSNLRQLKIIEEGLSERDAELRQRERLELTSFMVENPMPFIQTLEFISINIEGIMTRTLQNIHDMLLLSYMSQLKTLSVRMPYWKDHYAPRLISLTEFCVNDVNSDEHLRRLCYLKSPLRTLRIIATGDLVVHNLVQTLGNFPLLENVTIEFTRPNIKLLNREGIYNFNKLGVPSVKSVEIIHGGTLSYDFLQFFPVIRQLYICIDEALNNEMLGRMEGESDLQVFRTARDGKIYDSNIWNLLPTLDDAKIKYHVDDGSHWYTVHGTREGFIGCSSNSN